MINLFDLSDINLSKNVFKKEEEKRRKKCKMAKNSDSIKRFWAFHREGVSRAGQQIILLAIKQDNNFDFKGRTDIFFVSQSCLFASSESHLCAQVDSSGYLKGRGQSYEMIS